MSTAIGQKQRDERETSNEDQEFDGEDFMNLMEEVGHSVQKYCSTRPGVVAGVLFGLGFFCGWKLRPW